MTPHNISANTVRAKTSPYPLPLSEARQKLGISLDQIAQITKINPRYLRAIEEGRFAELPGGIFNISYIRQYARAIAYAETEILSYYNGQATKDY
ncbi:MAG TPA: helix-turn-helix transcriptional regulator [Bryobacterales bacterium]|nr:helix-turn-helix transcriptional regulator [Bryobacterales bacterium]